MRSYLYGADSNLGTLITPSPTHTKVECVKPGF